MEDIKDVTLSYSHYTAKRGQQTPYILNYSFSKTLDITEDNLPFVKSAIFLKNTSEKNIDGVYGFKKYSYGDNYYHLKGDTTTIYKGNEPYKRYWTEEDRINGDFTTNRASKWFFGTLKYTASGNNYEFRYSYVVQAKTYYDVVPLAGHPGYYSYKIFETIAIDNISDSSVTGQGTYTVVTATDVAGSPVVNTVVTKNQQKTAPMFDDTVELKVSGNYYVNGSYSGNYSVTSPGTVTFTGTIDGGTATLTDFDYSWDTRKQWKLFYSTSRIAVFLFDESNYIFWNKPNTVQYQSATLPYTKLYAEVNPEGYPQIEEDTHFSTYDFDGSRQIWTKINDNRYTFRIVGTIVLSGEAFKEGSIQVDFVDETYSHSGDTYARDSENRDPKEMPIYMPIEEEIKAKLMLSFKNPKTYHRERHQSI